MRSSRSRSRVKMLPRIDNTCTPKQREEVECIRNACVTSLAAASCHLLSAGQTLLPELLVLRE